MKKNKFKKLLSLLVVSALVISLTACSGDEKPDGENGGNGTGGEDRIEVKVGTVGESYEEIWRPIIDELAEEGIDIKLVSFADYPLPNAALNDGDIDLNAFQHYAYLNDEIENFGYDITPIGDTFLSAMCVYSTSISDLSELKDGDKIAVPGDAVNQGRALKILQGAGVIELDPEAGSSPDENDIVSNPLNLEIVPVDAAQVPSLLPDVAAGVINGNYALDFGLSPTDDAIFYDDVKFYDDKTYVNVIVARTEDADNEVYKRIVEAYQSDAVEQVFIDYFEGSYIPAWR